MTEFNVELVAGTPEDRLNLAREIAAYVDADTTNPVPGDWNSWLSNRVVTALEKAAGHTRGQWALLAEVCTAAANIAQNPSGKVLLMLERFGCERRIMVPNVQLLGDLRVSIEALIGSLVDGQRKDFLLSLFDFHVGIYARDVTGDYELAVRQQLSTAVRAEAKGDLVGAAMAHFVACFDEVNLAVSSCLSISGVLDRLHLAAHRLVGVCNDSTPIHRVWKYYNAPQHVFQAHIWTLEPIQPVDENYWRHTMFNRLPIVDKGHYDKNLPTIMSLDAGLLLLRNEREQASRIAEQVTKMDGARPIASMTARFVLAVLAGDAHLRSMADDKGEAHQMQRLAEAILQGRVKPWCIEHSSVSAKTV